ncbi:hypothetical protein Ddye_023922 [Dipteronia dyeriana]|uniref:Uncharacterized protein n=1 Tax=Dipteronia dyeriana TaxID=168575 RepID=A0AAD9TTX3_9ROSI|nr:hypothetical protein Ddye_023922 [Dipteronia dyeriana]
MEVVMVEDVMIFSKYWSALKAFGDFSIFSYGIGIAVYAFEGASYCYFDNVEVPRLYSALHFEPHRRSSQNISIGASFSNDPNAPLEIAEGDLEEESGEVEAVRGLVEDVTIATGGVLSLSHDFRIIPDSSTTVESINHLRERFDIPNSITVTVPHKRVLEAPGGFPRSVEKAVREG